MQTQKGNVQGQRVHGAWGFVSHFPPASVTVGMVAVPQNTVVLGLVLRLGPGDGEGGFVSKQAAGEPGRNPWYPAAGTTY